MKIDLLASAICIFSPYALARDLNLAYGGARRTNDGRLESRAGATLKNADDNKEARRYLRKEATVENIIRDVVETHEEQSFDFVLAGFPGSGTSALFDALKTHKETSVAASEKCAIASPGIADGKVQKILDRTLANLSAVPSAKRGFACQTAMYNYRSISRMSSHSPKTKFIIGMRHPVMMMQSFYNSHVAEMTMQGLEKEIPSFETVLDKRTPWKGVSMESSRFELFLMQMGKAVMTTGELDEFVHVNYDLAITPTESSVFLYTDEQLSDNDEKRSQSFGSELQSYLGLRDPIAPFWDDEDERGIAAFSRSINICDEQWAVYRAKLVEQGERTARWVRESFLEGEGVVVANKEHFIHSLESWGVDPCTA